MLNEFFSRLSKRESILFCIAVFAVVFCMAFFISRTIYETQSTRHLQSIAKLQNDIQSLNEFISKNRQNQSDFESLKLSLKELKSEQYNLDSNFKILKLNESDAINTILKGARNINVRVESVGTKIDNDDSLSVRVNVVIFASFSKIMQFLKYIEQRLYVDDVNIIRSSGVLKGEFNILLLK